MGREAKILLGILGLLTGVFVGVLSMKLLVPRPPSGTGPDIHAEIATAPDHELVEPPQLAASADRQALPPESEYRASRFTRAAVPTAPRDVEPPLAEPPASDPFVAPASYSSETTGSAPAIGGSTAAAAALSSPVSPDPMPVEHSPPPPWDPGAAGVDYVTQPGDCWWTVAERIYGDGRFYRALFAWNRAVDPRISLAPGTRLQIPPADRLRVAWPTLVPRD